MLLFSRVYFNLSDRKSKEFPNFKLMCISEVPKGTVICVKNWKGKLTM